MPRGARLALPIAVLVVLVSVSTPLPVAVQSATADSGQSVTPAIESPDNASDAAPVDRCVMGDSSFDSTSTPTAEGQDGHDDGVPVDCERRDGTDPMSADTDGTDTDPMSADTDGDGIPDRVERGRVVGHHPRVVLPELHPTEKDVVVDVVYAKAVDDEVRLSEREVAAMRATWAGFPVDNPSDSSGIHLHVSEYDSAALEGAFGSDFSTDAVDALYEDRYGRPPGDAVVNMIVVAEFDVGSSELVAFGSKGGNVAVVRASESRPIVVNHELMHLVLGPINGERDCDIAADSGHTCRGYLAPGGQAEPFLTALLTQALNRPWSSTNASHPTNRTVATTPTAAVDGVFHHGRVGPDVVTAG